MRILTGPCARVSNILTAEEWLAKFLTQSFNMKILSRDLWPTYPERPVLPASRIVHGSESPSLRKSFYIGKRFEARQRQQPLNVCACLFDDLGGT
jgi:hypothetical protein